MKRTTLLLVVIVFISFNGISQENKGKFLIGGLTAVSLSDNNSEQTDRYYSSKSQYFSLSLPLGYFVSNKVLLGIKPGFNVRQSTTESFLNDAPQERESLRQLYSIGPFIRYYQPVVNRLDFFMELSAVYGFGKETSKYTNDGVIQFDNKGQQSNFSANFSPGLSYRISDWLFVDATIGRLSYNNSHYKPDEMSEDDSEDTRKSFNFYFNSFNFGLSARIGNK